MVRKAKPSAGNNSYTPVKFVPCNLDATDKVWLGEHDLGAEFPLSDILTLAEAGYKISISPDKDNHRFICSLVDKGGVGDSKNTCISGSGATPLDAWHSLAYRHFVKLGGDWLEIIREGEGTTSKYG